MTLLQYVSAAPFKMCVLGEGDFEGGGVNFFYYLPFIRFFSQKLRGFMLSTTVTHPQGSHIRPLCIALVFGLDTNVILYLVNCISYFGGHAYNYAGLPFEAMPFMQNSSCNVSTLSSSLLCLR